MTDRAQLRALMGALDVQVALGRIALRDAMALVHQITGEMAQLKQPLSLGATSLAEARNAARHDTWRDARREELTRELALARATEATARETLAKLEARKEALEIILEENATAAKTVERRTANEQLLGHVLLRQTS